MKTVLEQLKEVMGDSYGELLDAYLADAPRRLDLMRIAANKNDLEQLSNEAHALKGSSSNLGAAELAGVCSEISDGLKNYSQADLEQKVHIASQLYKEIKIILEQEKGSL